MKHLVKLSNKPTGRPSIAALTPADLSEIKSLYVAGTNHSDKQGSITLAWVRFCEANFDRFGHLVSDHMPATTIPTAVVEACRQSRALIAAARGGAPRQRHEGAYVPGTMRRHHEMERRLWAGERASVDDATRNVACYIPWPWGGCPCSDKFGVRLGRWQTLLVHDDASSFIPFISSVFRWHQSYNGIDAASVIYRSENQVCQWDHWSIEGGVWQTSRPMAVLAGRFISAKGRPNQKLVENSIGRLWGIMAGQTGDVGRKRGEMKVGSDLYVRARAGKVDPRDHFLSLTQGQEQLYQAVEYLCEKRIISRTYGSWVPKSRWEADLQEFPRTIRAAVDDFLIFPACETRKCRSGMLRLTHDGPMGMPMVWTFAHDRLWEYEGRDLTVYFDPMGAWPVQGVVTLKGSRKPLLIVTCINSYAESKDRAAEMIKSIRKTMMQETRVILTRHTERQIRHNQGVISTSNDVGLPIPEKGLAQSVHSGHSETTSQIRTERHTGEALAPLPRVSRDDLASSLSRRAKIARESKILV